MENNNTTTQNPDTQQTAAQSNQQSTPAIDYGKIQQMLDGTLAAKEDTALKAYFRQQGLSQQEVEQAITAFKEQKAANQPDVIGMQNQITETQAQLAASQKAVQAAQVESAATMMAVSLGIEAKTIPYILKMADLSQVVGEDGNINEETLKTAVNKVLEDVPALKPQADGKTGFTQVGTGGNPAQHPQQTFKKWGTERGKFSIICVCCLSSRLLGGETNIAGIDPNSDGVQGVGDLIAVLFAVNRNRANVCICCNRSIVDICKQ